MPTLTINGTEIEVEKGTSILQASEMLGYEIPRFCYHDRLSVPANCRMCLVEVKGGPPKPVASCAMACADGMEVLTDSEMVHKARKGVMEFLLINHPLDCPICDQGGECDLQDQAMAYGFDRSRYYENKRATRDKEIGPLIKTIMTRCIHCTRCVRFGDEIAGVSELGLLNRGEDVEIGPFIEQAVTTELSGNMIDICPVGALTSKPYAFHARPWELRKTETIDVLDAVGSNIRADASGGEVMRILPRLHEDINEEWISDKTRFAYDGLLRQRLDRPYIRDRETGKLRPAPWDQALARAAEAFRHVEPVHMAALAGDLVDVESTYALKALMKGLASPNMECRVDGADFDVSQPAGYRFNTTIAGIEDSDAILLIGTNPRWEATMVNARIRKAWYEKRIPIGLVGEERDLTYPKTYIGAGPESLEDLLKGKHKFAEKLKDAERPMLIIGMGAFQRPDGKEIQARACELAEHFGMIQENWNGFNVLHNAAGRMGALMMEFVPQGAPIGWSEIKLVYAHGADSFDFSRLSEDCFLIYQGHHGDEGAQRADVILPGAAYTEKDALYVNTEGRVQMAKQAVFPPGQAKEDWRILRALSEVLGHKLPFDTLAQLRDQLCADYPAFAEIDRVMPASWPASWTPSGAQGRAENHPFRTPVKNYYMTDPISRSSRVMAQCTESFLQERPELIAAE